MAHVLRIPAWLPHEGSEMCTWLGLGLGLRVRVRDVHLARVGVRA